MFCEELKKLVEDKLAGAEAFAASGNPVCKYISTWTVEEYDRVLLWVYERIMRENRIRKYVWTKYGKYRKYFKNPRLYEDISTESYSFVTPVRTRLFIQPIAGRTGFNFTLHPWHGSWYSPDSVWWRDPFGSETGAELDYTVPYDYKKSYTRFTDMMVRDIDDYIARCWARNDKQRVKRERTARAAEEYPQRSDLTLRKIDHRINRYERMIDKALEVRSEIRESNF